LASVHEKIGVRAQTGIADVPGEQGEILPGPYFQTSAFGGGNVKRLHRRGAKFRHCQKQYQGAEQRRQGQNQPHENLKKFFHGLYLRKIML